MTILTALKNDDPDSFKKYWPWLRYKKGINMEHYEELIQGKYYHIYNCGINGESIFRENKDYERFLRLYEKFIFPVCDTYAWVLMKNHFHIFLRIKENVGYKYSLKSVGYDKEKFNEVKWETIDSTCQLLPEGEPGNKKEAKDMNKTNPSPHLHFSHFFNAYAKYYNFRYERHGSLFERSFNRKVIDNSRYFKNVVIYIHQNPVHHGFCKHSMEYGWSSYMTLVSLKPTSVKREEVLGWFDNVGEFIDKHNKTLNRSEIENYLGL